MIPEPLIYNVSEEARKLMSPETINTIIITILLVFAVVLVFVTFYDHRPIKPKPKTRPMATRNPRKDDDHDQ